MKRLIVHLLPISVILIFCSCEEEFSPKIPFVEQYVVNGIIDIGYANNIGPDIKISKTYNFESTSPPQTHNIVSDSSATVFIYVNNREYELKYYKNDDESSLGYYCLKPEDIIPPFQAYEFSMIANFPDGSTLKAKTDVPDFPSILFSMDFFNGVTTKIDQWRFGKKWIMTWDIEKDQLCFPKLSINYYKENYDTLKSIDVPSTYLKSGNGFIPYYPQYTYDGYCSYDFSAIDSTMLKISEGDSVKNNYKIISVVFSMIIFSKTLSLYYSSTNGYLDNNTIRLDEKVYSNIENGMGIFGCYRTIFSSKSINHDYARSFGYSAYD